MPKSRENSLCPKSPPNPQVPAFTDSVRIEYDEVRGRYGVAVRDLVPGEVILQVCRLLILSFTVTCLHRSLLWP